jgi:hypothetical protein
MKDKEGSAAQFSGLHITCTCLQSLWRTFCSSLGTAKMFKINASLLQKFIGAFCGYQSIFELIYMIARLSGKPARPRSTSVGSPPLKLCRCEVLVPGTALLSSIMTRPAVDGEIPKTQMRRANGQRYQNASVWVYVLAVGRVRLEWKQNTGGVEKLHH